METGATVRGEMGAIRPHSPTEGWHASCSSARIPPVCRALLRGPAAGEPMSAASVRMTVEWTVPIAQTRAITSALHSLAAMVRSVQSCITCSVSSDAASRGLVRYEEEWLSEDDLRRRLRSPEFLQLATLMEDTTQPPRVEFAIDGATRGRDFLVEVRGRG